MTQKELDPAFVVVRDCFAVDRLQDLLKLIRTMRVIVLEFQRLRSGYRTEDEVGGVHVHYGGKSFFHRFDPCRRPLTRARVTVWRTGLTMGSMT